jgi:hypothetical protein
MRGDRNKQLTVLSEAEKLAFYGLPALDDFQGTKFFAMTEAERALAFQRQGFIEQVYCQFLPVPSLPFPIFPSEITIAMFHFYIRKRGITAS